MKKLNDVVAMHITSDLNVRFTAVEAQFHYRLVNIEFIIKGNHNTV